MGKIVEAAPADIVVLIGGKIISRTIDIGMTKTIIAGSVRQKIEWTLCNGRKEGKDIIVDILIVPDKEIIDNPEKSSVKIRIFAKNELRQMLEMREKQLRDYLEQEEWFKSVNFYYENEKLFKSICLNV